MAETATDERPLDRKEAAAYLTKRWFRISHRTLAAKAAAIPPNDTGPVYVLTAPIGGRAIYLRADLDAWAQRRLTPPKKHPSPPSTVGALAPLRR